MPIYEFVCEGCGNMVERLQKLTDPPPDACPECGGKMAKIMSRNSFQLKGGGWYRDLYSSAKTKGVAGAAASASGSDGAAPGGAEKPGGSAAPKSDGDSSGASSPAPSAPGGGESKAAAAPKKESKAAAAPKKDHQ